MVWYLPLSFMFLVKYFRFNQNFGKLSPICFLSSLPTSYLTSTPTSTPVSWSVSSPISSKVSLPVSSLSSSKVSFPVSSLSSSPFNAPVSAPFRALKSTLTFWITVLTRVKFKKTDNFNFFSAIYNSLNNFLHVWWLHWLSAFEHSNLTVKTECWTLE